MDGVKLLFKDGSWAMMRASGTEPVVRIYIETTNPDNLERYRKLVLEAVKGLSG
jgi:phosphomannomutase